MGGAPRKKNHESPGRSAGKRRIKRTAAKPACHCYGGGPGRVLSYRPAKRVARSWPTEYAGQHLEQPCQPWRWAYWAYRADPTGKPGRICHALCCLTRWCQRFRRFPWVSDLRMCPGRFTRRKIVMERPFLGQHQYNHQYTDTSRS